MNTAITGSITGRRSTLASTSAKIMPIVVSTSANRCLASAVSAGDRARRPTCRSDAPHSKFKTPAAAFSPIPIPSPPASGASGPGCRNVNHARCKISTAATRIMPPVATALSSSTFA